MPILANSAHEKFAHLIATGQKAVQAYRNSGGRAKAWEYDAAYKLGKNLLVKARVKELQEAAQKGVVLSMQERREYLARVVRVKVAEITDDGADGDLIQELTYTRRETQGGTSVTRKIKIPDKRGAIMDDAKLAGDLVERDGSLDENGLLKLLANIGKFIALPGEKIIDGAIGTARLQLEAGVEDIDAL